MVRAVTMFQVDKHVRESATLGLRTSGQTIVVGYMIALEAKYRTKCKADASQDEHEGSYLELPFVELVMYIEETCADMVHLYTSWLEHVLERESWWMPVFLWNWLT